jgi:sugar lactone lactonase YvrE
VAEEYKLTDDPNLRGICGSSSGGSCAFTAAWERPDYFRRVVSFIGSFSNLRGANEYPDLIRKTEPKPIRVFQQDGDKDLNIYAGSWFLANQDVASALEWAGYQHRFDTGTTNHDSKQSGPLFPEAVKWAWQDYDKPITVGANPKQPVMDIILPDQGWEVVSEGHKFTEGTTADAEGNIYFTDIPNNQIWKIGPDGKPAVFASDTHGANGLKIAPDSRLFACEEEGGRVVAYDVKTAKATVIAEGFQRPNDLVISHDGNIYVSEPPLSQVWHISPTGEKKIVIEKKNGIMFPNGIGLTPDQSQLVIVDTRGCNFSIFQIAPDGTLIHGAPFYTAQIASTDRESGADGLCLDKEGRLYVATRIGIQVFDQAGRVIAIIPKPQDAKNRNQWLANISFGGKDFADLYIACGDKIYKRKTKVKGAMGFETPTKPEKPRL